jgi:outer membrane lipoprotein-sorting protein
MNGFWFAADVRHGAYVTIADMRVQRRDSVRNAAWLALTILAVSSVTGQSSGNDLFDDLYLRGQRQNRNLRTLTATFVETTTSALLAKPLTARGTVVVERPSRVALAYTEPIERFVIVDGDRLTLTWPSRGMRQTRDIGAAQQRVQKYFVDSSPTELRTHFDITAQVATDRPGYVITFLPKRKQIKEGVARLDLWIDPTSLLMTSMKMTFPNGDTKLMTFTDVKANAPIDPTAFRRDALR